jgi:DNA polymerase I-like protein with 3'-5' exonuclease and polymerase domains
MHDNLYFLCIPNPFRKVPFLFCKDQERTFVLDDISVLACYDSIVAYDFESFVDTCRDTGIESLPKILDIRTAIKLATGKSKSEFKPNNEPWKLKKIIGKSINKKSLAWLAEIVDLKTYDYEAGENTFEMISDVMTALEHAWAQICEDLKNKREYDRFVTVETEVYNLFLNTQLKGVRVSQEKLQNQLRYLNTCYYRAIKSLELSHGFLAQQIHNNLTWGDVERYSDICESSHEVDSDFWRFVEIYGEFDSFLMNLSIARNSLIDYHTLLRYSLDQYSRIYPRFDVVGTVTARVLVESPGFQYLKKTSRSIITASAGKTLLYADFTQFEPGIVAHLSRDKILTELYNRGDVYNELSLVLFGSKNNRKIAKILFLAFLYGMSKDNLGKLIDKIASPEARKEAFAFFNKFEILCRWKEDVCNEAKATGYAETSFGNRRYIKNCDNLEAKELRWIPNQIVQGTASLIFKKSLIELSKSNSQSYYLLPMHDAILVEVPKKTIAKEKKIIESVFVKNFEHACPTIKAKVSFEKFSD